MSRQLQCLSIRYIAHPQDETLQSDCASVCQCGEGSRVHVVGEKKKQLTEPQEGRLECKRRAKTETRQGDKSQTRFKVKYARPKQ